MPKKPSSKRKGKGKSKAGKDPITGRSLLLSQDGNTIEIRDDVVYEVVDGGDINTFAGDVYTPLNAMPTGRPPGGTSYVQFQMGNDRLIRTSYGEFDEGVQYRNVLLGNFSYDKNGRMTKFGTTSSRMIQVSDDNLEQLFGTVEQFPQLWTTSAPFDYNKTFPPQSTVLADYCYLCLEQEKGGGLAAIRAFGGGKYFFEGWQNNLFDTSLV